MIYSVATCGKTMKEVQKSKFNIKTVPKNIPFVHIPPNKKKQTIKNAFLLVYAVLLNTFHTCISAISANYSKGFMKC